MGNIDSDIVAIFDIENFIAISQLLHLPANKVAIVFQGEIDNGKFAIVDLRDEYPAFFDCGRVHNHGVIFLANLLFHYNPPSNLFLGPVAAHFVNFALYVHKTEVLDMEIFWSISRSYLVNLFTDLDRTCGNYYERLTARNSIFNVTKQSTVIVLGKYTDSEGKELVQICDYLKGKGYEAALIKNFPEIPMMSNEEKVRSWSGAARFCVMIDREPSGHILEYEILKQQRCILAFLHPKDSGSTYMVGDAPLVDINYIKNFTFKHSPLEIMDEAIKWAEELVKIREDVYNERYPWRKRGGNLM